MSLVDTWRFFVVPSISGRINGQDKDSGGLRLSSIRGDEF